MKKEKICQSKSNILFENEDAHNISKKSFDISINWRTLSWLPYYNQILKKIITVTKEHIFLSSLFYHGDIDFITQIREFKIETGKNHFNDYYNVYTLPEFKKFVKRLGAKKVEV